MYERAIPWILGVFLAWVTVFPASRLHPRTEQGFFRAIMVVVALGFFGFPAEVGDFGGMALELAVAAVMLLLVAGSVRWLYLLPIAYLLHGLWDLVWLLEGVTHAKPAWLVQLCVPYDWLVAGYLFRRCQVWEPATG